MKTEEEIQERAQRLSDVRELVDFLEAHPEVPMPHCLGRDPIAFWGGDKDEFMAVVHAFGSFEKAIDGTNFTVTKKFGSGKAHIKLSIPRTEVCTKQTVIKTVPVDEWVCSPLLINGQPIEEAVTV